MAPLVSRHFRIELQPVPNASVGCSYHLKVDLFQPESRAASELGSRSNLMNAFRPILINQDVMLATACAIEALLSDYLGHQKPQIADRFFDFLQSGVQFDPQLFCKESGT
jgi:hypothetical protein